jgi:hypothetical protein
MSAKPDFNHEDSFEAVQNLSWRETVAAALSLRFETDLQAIAQEDDQDVNFDSPSDPEGRYICNRLRSF